MKKLFWAFLLISVFFLSSIYAGTDYYLDATGGNDGNNGLSPQNAWRTIGKLNDSWSRITPGDRILLKRDTIFSDETLYIRKGGTSSNPIVIGAY
ncbi:MAG: hypothetical protein JSV17_15025, partial [Candidatus Aminicenantes bacterium]